MRITIVIASLGGGGAERVAVNLANAWCQDHDVTILTTASGAAPAYAIDPRVRLLTEGLPRAPERAQLTAASLSAVLHALERFACPEFIEQAAVVALLRESLLATDPDVVVSHIDFTNMRVLAALHGTGVPAIVCEHTDVRRVPLLRWQHAREVLYARAHAVVASHPSSADWLARRGARAVSIANPLVPPPPRSVARGARRRVVSLSRFAGEKRIEHIIRAFEMAARDLPEWDLELHGDGPNRWSMSELAKQLAPEKIHIHPFADPYDVLPGADLYVSASWIEGFGNSIWEALACNVPVVAMECGPSVGTLVRDGIDGVIVKGGTPAALAAALKNLMVDEATRAAYAKRAGEVVERFSLAASLSAWERLLGGIAREREVQRAS